MRNHGDKRGQRFFASHRSAILLTALGLAINIAYILNSYLSNAPQFFDHLGGNLFDHLVIIFILPLLFAIGYLADRSRAVQERLKKALEREAYISHSLQAVYYPQIRQIRGYQLAARYRSVLEESELGGDYYDIFPLGNNKTALTITDVSGKGLKAAIMGAFVKSVIRAYLREHPNLSETVARISSAIYHEQDMDLFVTAFIGVLHEPSGSISYINAGHPGPLHISTSREVEILHAESMPLGIFPEQEFKESEIVLVPGDYLVLFSDGLYEFRGGDEATPETIAREVCEQLPTDADTLVGNLLTNAENHAHGVLSDDVAVIALRRNLAE